MNFWIKVCTAALNRCVASLSTPPVRFQKVYLAHGSNASWDWLKMVSPCIDILRELANQMHSTLGSYQGITHHTPDLRRDLNVLMDSLVKEKVYAFRPGRKLDKDDLPAVDTITKGTNALIHGGATSPLAQYNAAFVALRKRMTVRVLCGGNSTEVPMREVPTSNTQQKDAHGELDSTVPQDIAGENSVAEGLDDEDGADGDEEDGRADDEVELGLDEAEDVALEMDMEESWNSWVDLSRDD